MLVIQTAAELSDFSVQYSEARLCYLNFVRICNSTVLKIFEDKSVIVEHWCSGTTYCRQEFVTKDNSPILIMYFQCYNNNIIYQYKASGLTGLFIGQYNSKDYGTFTGGIYSLRGSTSCSSHIIFILVPAIFHCSIALVGASHIPLF